MKPSLIRDFLVGLGVFMLLALIMQLGNYMLIAMVEPIIWRYTVYTNQVLFTLLALFVTCKPMPDNMNDKPGHQSLSAR